MILDKFQGARVDCSKLHLFFVFYFVFPSPFCLLHQDGVTGRNLFLVVVEKVLLSSELAIQKVSTVLTEA